MGLSTLVSCRTLFCSARLVRRRFTWLVFNRSCMMRTQSGRLRLRPRCPCKFRCKTVRVSSRLLDSPRGGTLLSADILLLLRWVPGLLNSRLISWDHLSTRRTGLLTRWCPRNRARLLIRCDYLGAATMRGLTMGTSLILLRHRRGRWDRMVATVRPRRR